MTMANFKHTRTTTSSPEVTWLEHETDHSPQSNAQVTNAWNCASTPFYALHVYVPNFFLILNVLNEIET
jgi:hypothetical protein